MAYIDVKNLKEEHIRTSFDGNLWIMTRRHKTNVQANIPLLDVAKSILEKYRGKLPNGILLPILSNQKMNAYLKEIGDSCGIDKRLTFHLARHSNSPYPLKTSKSHHIQTITDNDLETRDLPFISFFCTTYKERLIFAVKIQKFFDIEKIAAFLRFPSTIYLYQSI